MHPLSNPRPRRVRFAAVACLLSTLAAPLSGPLSAAPQAARELNSRIETLWSGSKLAGATYGVSIIDLQTGRILADQGAEQPLIPASNQKLITSGAALHTLGPDFVFKTELLLDGERLIIRGSGDPALADSVILDQMSGKMSVEGLLDALVGSVKKAGAAHISEIIMDDRVFDREFVHPTWPVDQLDRWYCAPIAGVNFHTNVLSVFPSPSSAGIGRPPTILLEPAAPWIELENRARTAESGRNSIRVSRDPAANRFTVQGEVGIARVRVEISVCDPALFAGQLVAAALPGVGVGIGDAPALPDSSGRKTPTREQQLEAIRTVRLADPKETLQGRVVAVVTTHIEDILTRCNTDSYNLYAEAMLKRIGHEITGEPGSFANGSSVIRMTLSQQLGPEAATTTVISDGSGMSRENRVSPRTMTRWLDSLQKNPRIGPMFIASLATPDSRDSMRRRFRDARLATSLTAKTGTIDGVRCLSGYLTDPATGRRLAFSIMVNGLKEGVQTPQALQFHENVVAAADEWLVAQRPPKTRTRPAGAAAAAPGSPAGLPDPVGAGRP